MRNWKLTEVLYEGDDWSFALGQWKSDGETKWRPVLAQRWNGWSGSKGNPVSRGFATWFILPDETYDHYLGIDGRAPSEFISTDKLEWVRKRLAEPPA